MTHMSPYFGFSLLEAIVGVLLVTAASAVALPIVSTMMEVADTRQRFVETANAARRCASSAIGGPSATFSIARDGQLARGLVVNPAYIPAPQGTELVDEIEFEGGTGTARTRGRRAVVSIVIAEQDESAFAHAIVAGTAGRIELKTYANGEWKEFQ